MRVKIINFFENDLDAFCQRHPFVVVGGALGFCVISDFILRCL